MEKLVVVEDLADDELRGRELEVSLREDIGHEHSEEIATLELCITTTLCPGPVGLGLWLLSGLLKIRDSHLCSL